MKKNIFKGIATALYTPFKNEGKTVDYAAFERLVERQLRSGINALVALGTTGESPTVSAEERKEIISFVVKRVNGRVPVIIGAGSKCNENGILRHYATIAGATDLPIIIYNVPSRTGIDISPETYAKLARIKTVAAIKECNTSLGKLNRSINLTDGEISFYCGSDEALPDFINSGADGAISVSSNVIPDKIVDIYLKKRSYYETEREFVNALFCDVNPIPVKYVTEVLFGESGDLRLPLTRAGKPQREYLTKAMNKLLKGV